MAVFGEVGGAGGGSYRARWCMGVAPCPCVSDADGPPRSSPAHAPLRDRQSRSPSAHTKEDDVMDSSNNNASHEIVES